MNQICTYSKYMDQADLGQAQDIHSSALRDAFIKKKKNWYHGTMVLVLKSCLMIWSGIFAPRL